MEIRADLLLMILPYLAGIWALLVVLTVWKPQRFKNAVLLMAALMMTLLAISTLFGDKMMDVVFGCALMVFFILLFVPFLLVWNGLVVMKREGRAFSNMLSLMLGILIAVGEIAFIFTAFHGLYGKLSVAASVSLFIGNTAFFFSLVILAFVIYSIFIQYIPRFYDFDYVIIHGCGLIGGERVSKLLADRVDQAIKIYERCRVKPMLIASGGQGSDEKLSEAAAMKAYLIEHGIPEDHIYLEDKSTTTMENLEFSRDYIYGREGRKRIALVSSNYHVYRCLLYAEKLKMKCRGIGARVAWYYWPTALLREFVAIFTRPKNLIWIVISYVLLVLVPTIQIIMG